MNHEDWGATICQNLKKLSFIAHFPIKKLIKK